MNALLKVSAEYNGIRHKDKDISLSPPSSVGQIVNAVLTSSAHIAEVNMIAKSQPPQQ